MLIETEKGGINILQEMWTKYISKFSIEIFRNILSVTSNSKPDCCMAV